MSAVEFHSPVGAPATYETLYVSILPAAGEDGRPFDAAAAARHAEALARKGSPGAQFVLAHMLLAGQGVPPDAAAAYGWFALAAQSGRADALNMVGRCHECGWGTDVDKAEAARFYRRAVAAGSAWAMFNLASLMLAGDGVARDARGALALFVRAARRGNAKAMSMLGQYREEGWSSRVKLAAAARWYRRAAERGCFRGAYNLARFLARAGKLDAAATLLRASCAKAPPQFCREVGQTLLAHSDARLRAVAREALERAALPPGRLAAAAPIVPNEPLD
jgi:TPR repeat protein